jgi:hypothetical protein
MKAKAVFRKNGKIISEFPFEIIDNGDFSAEVKDSFSAFREAHPTVALFEVIVTFEKLVP